MDSYSFKNGSLYINGRSMTDYDEGDDVITFARLNDAASHVVGADGKMAVAVHADMSGTGTFRLKQTSPDSGFLYGLVNSMQAGAFIPIVIQYKDSRRDDLVAGTVGYIQKPADTVRGQGVNTQEWVVVSEKQVTTAKDGKNEVIGLLAEAVAIGAIVA